ncbi:hypothetical protein EDC01DRAFT_631588 [Geopyxis carbonaria]|nr:hypothetical protein EDC01DRAFT_631588 [Geopyxis carbonaria]
MGQPHSSLHANSVQHPDDIPPDSPAPLQSEPWTRVQPSAFFSPHQSASAAASPPTHQRRRPTPTMSMSVFSVSPSLPDRRPRDNLVLTLHQALEWFPYPDTLASVTNNLNAVADLYAKHATVKPPTEPRLVAPVNVSQWTLPQLRDMLAKFACLNEVHSHECRTCNDPLREIAARASTVVNILDRRDSGDGDLLFVMNGRLGRALTRLLHPDTWVYPRPDDIDEDDAADLDI